MEKSKQKRGTMLRSVWFRFKKNRLAMAGLIILVLLFVLAIGVSLFGDYSKAIDMNVMDKLKTPSPEHWFGTDHNGRDVFQRVLFGARVSLVWGFLCVFSAMIIGIIAGAVAGYFGGMTDLIIMRITDVFLSIPVVILAIAIVAALGSNLFNVLLALTLAGWPGYCRIVRAAVMGVNSQDYIEAARCFGSKNSRIITRHILPNCMAPIIVQTTLGLGGSILAIAILSFMGLGVQPPTPEWGYMMSEAQSYLRDYPYLILFPGAATAITVMSFNLLGDGLRDALDPKLRK